MQKVIFISWAANCSRSDHLARLLGGKSYMVYAGWLGSHTATIWLKYFIQSVQTLWLLLRERPQVVMVMVPPIFAALPVYLYCKITGCRFATDNHTAAFTMRRWQRLKSLHGWLEKRATCNIVTNERLRQIQQAWGVPPEKNFLIGDLPVQFPHIESPAFLTHKSVAAPTVPSDSDQAQLRNGFFAITVVCSFNPDEPLENILHAAAELPDVIFYCTGKLKDAPPAILTRKPKNLTFTDFLSVPQYAGLLQESHGVLVLTTRDHTMQRGAYEAMALGTPIITSDWPLLRNTFADGCLFVDNSPKSIVAAVRQLQADWPRFKAAIQVQRARRQGLWNEKEKQLRRILSLPEKD
ncbi:MAG: glycosyltransferase [candidate division KSB1 bacterium]|nr:glycosyltransferase [candidate division KSB1 bacterium]MDZ7302282.1 glycosyltransferase [candidate division KSB1 bacterium]MDZ7311388.1 glycosyltransferase [candidate division KSB1 bacterium]